MSSGYRDLTWAMRGHKRFKEGSWRLAVANGVDPLTGRRRTIYETVRAPGNRAGAKVADARLAELIAAVESGRYPEVRVKSGHGPSVDRTVNPHHFAGRGLYVIDLPPKNDPSPRCDSPSN
jgi:hypothetical protein